MKRNENNPNFKIARVIVTYNNENGINETLINLFSQKYHLDEIVVVDNASLDSTASLIRKDYANVT